MDEHSWHCIEYSDQNHYKKKKRNTKRFSEEALQIAEERIEAKGKGEN